MSAARKYFLMKLFLIVTLLAASVMSSRAQLMVHLKMDRKTYLANEQVSAVVTITNRTGAEVFLRTVPKGRITQSWLDLSVRDGRGRTLSRRRAPEFRAARIPAGQSVAKRIVLNPIYGVNNAGRYSVTATVRIEETQSVYSSNSGHFGVNNGQKVFSTQFGAPKTKYPKREYRVLSFNDGKRTSIYAAVHDARTKASINTFRLSEALLFNKPSATIDGKSRLHVLYLATPEVYVHAIVDRDGRLSHTQYYKRGLAGAPSFASFANGEVKVRGAIPFDPQKDAAERNRARRISERPGR